MTRRLRKKPRCHVNMAASLTLRRHSEIGGAPSAPSPRRGTSSWTATASASLSLSVASGSIGNRSWYSADRFLLRYLSVSSATTLSWILLGKNKVVQWLWDIVTNIRYCDYLPTLVWFSHRTELITSWQILVIATIFTKSNIRYLLLMPTCTYHNS